MQHEVRMRYVKILNNVAAHGDRPTIKLTDANRLSTAKVNIKFLFVFGGRFSDYYISI